VREGGSRTSAGGGKGKNVNFLEEAQNSEERRVRSCGTQGSRSQKKKTIFDAKSEKKDKRGKSTLDADRTLKENGEKGKKPF